MLKHTLLAALFSGTALLSSTAALANETSTPAFVNEYLSDIVQTNKDIATSFATLTAQAPEQTAWIAEYGTASPGVEVSINDKSYVAFSGCEPHNCPQSAYVMLLNPKTNQFTKGAVRYDTSHEQAPHQSTVVWLGEYDFDYVPAIWQQFYPID